MSDASPPFRTLEESVPVDLFKSEVRLWADQIGAEPTEVRLRKMRKKWASCSSSGRLTFNTDLLSEPASFRTEVIVHELLHLKIPNHGKVFKALLKAHLSDGDATYEGNKHEDG